MDEESYLDDLAAYVLSCKKKKRGASELQRYIYTQIHILDELRAYPADLKIAELFLCYSTLTFWNRNASRSRNLVLHSVC